MQIRAVKFSPQTSQITWKSVWVLNLTPHPHVRNVWCRCDLIKWKNPVRDLISLTALVEFHKILNFTSSLDLMILTDLVSLRYWLNSVWFGDIPTIFLFCFIFLVNLKVIFQWCCLPASHLLRWTCRLKCKPGAGYERKRESEKNCNSYKLASFLIHSIFHHSPSIRS